MSRQQRLAALLDLVVERTSLTIDELIAELGVSPATIRRDVDYLATQKLLTRTRGGVMQNPTSSEAPMRFRTVRNNKQKIGIAKKAADLVHPGAVIALNGGTTTTAISAELISKVTKDFSFSHRPLTVVTNAVNIANDLIVHPQVRVVLTGGVARARSYELVGPLAALIFSHINVDAVFLGAVGITPAGGVFTDNESEAEVNRALVAVSERVYVVIDSSKIGLAAFARICGSDSIYGVITDEHIDSDMRAAFEERGIKVIIGA